MDQRKRRPNRRIRPKAFIESINLFERLFGRKQPYPELLYHYTNFAGVKGILQGHSVWATFSECLNDASERTYARGVVEKYSQPTVKEEIPSWAKAAKFPPESIFITCFCDDADNLNMWRSYTNQAGGFALGFEPFQLSNLHPNGRLNSYGPRLVKVHYGDVLTEEMLALLNGPDQPSMKWIFETAIKHPAFTEEKEWRVYIPEPPADAMSFASGNSTVKPYVEMKYPNGAKLPLKRLIYGPTLRSDRALQTTLKWMLKKYGYGDVEVVGSTVPYRL